MSMHTFSANKEQHQMYGNLFFLAEFPLPVELTGLYTAGWNIVKLMCLGAKPAQSGKCIDNGDK